MFYALYKTSEKILYFAAKANKNPLTSVQLIFKVLEKLMLYRGNEIYSNWTLQDSKNMKRFVFKSFHQTKWLFPNLFTNFL